jgi:hypothetical protein
MTTSPENHASEQFLNYRKLIARMSATLKKLEIAEKTLSIRGFRTGVETLGQDFTHIENTSKEFLREQQTCLEDLCKKLNHPDYSTKFESALREQKVHFSGAFPDYDIPPFKLSISIDNYTARLSMGRKSQQIDNLSPVSLAQWVGSAYDKLVNSKFKHERFCGELFEAYRYLSKSEWYVPVPIKEVYRILTIKAEAKQEYPESRFVFDLSRLLREFEIKHSDHDGTQYIIDLSPHKQSSKNYTVVNEAGKERAIGNLTIRKV